MASKLTDADQAKAARQFKYLIHALSNVRLDTAVRRASESELFVFVRAPEKKLHSAVHKARYGSAYLLTCVYIYVCVSG